MKTALTAAVALTMLCVDGSVFAKTTRNEYSPGDIAKTVEIEVTDSALEVTQSGRQVYSVADFDEEKCELYTAREGNNKRIYLSLLPKGTELCRGTVSIKVPKGIPLRIKAFSGNTILKSLKNEITVESSSGDVTATGLTLSAHISTIGGNISSVWTKVPKNGDIAVATKSGNIRLLFPAKAMLTISAQSTSGHVTNLLKTFPTTDANVSAISDSGNITLGN